MRPAQHLALILLAALLFPGVARAEGGPERVEGYEEYRFGMDLQQADAVRADDTSGPCPYPGVYQCLTRPTVIFGEPARVVVQVEDASRRVEQILVEFDRVRDENKESECDRTANNILEALLGQYGDPDTVDEREAVWFGKKGGMLSFTSLCVNRHKGMVTVTYRQSGRL